MASGKALNAANLQALGAARLASLPLEISTGDAAARRRLRLELAGSAGSADVARQVTKRLASIAKARGFKGLAEEQPAAYKDVDHVVDVVDRAGISKKVARLRPVGVIKG